MLNLTIKFKTIHTGVCDAPLSKPDRQDPIQGIYVWIGCVTIQKHTIIANGIPTTNSHSIPLHPVKQKNTEAATGDENLIAHPDVAKFEPIIQYSTLHLEFPKSALYILTNTLYVHQKVPLKGLTCLPACMGK